MNPAPSVIIFTTLSGAGFGFLAYLALGILTVAGWPAFFLWALGYGLAVVGLLASAFHLGNPQRALLAFTQWRSSWLSREAWAAVATLILLAPMALSDWLGLGLPRWIGGIGAVLCVATLLCTSMIYTQLKSVPRWHDPMTPVTFLAFAAAGGAILAAPKLVAIALCLLLAAVLAYGWKRGDTAFARAGQTIGSATGLDRLGETKVFEPAHTAGNYLMREMIYVVGRRHVAKLRVIALGLVTALPVILLALPFPALAAPAFVLHLAGAACARWLFFAQAEHVVGLYYGARG
ncbi:DmsC/YnfH family molybdoenzyme membrane anchor subunit [Xinfangfangia sp. CPCC 101601]|uniref:DmsC/YnfH family molybdoenzyme membrane anchor subunit n=1 Tax=Pseudogemmobacter lacusdianii TaxID=3069608 RepID=A0ABU0VZU0_9RHOB|nr:DmsC/YnfH family molybdoenzyme membrane anchor subunit [Xinfangfangia sp. CPCC 101601]MDQ2067018.1 DmsC/YnfH family molybdoenzyme membrane anchor subunit [Xinfangfangia sp. CPCC 101601]